MQIRTEHAGTRHHRKPREGLFMSRRIAKEVSRVQRRITERRQIVEELSEIRSANLLTQP